ncbi:MAG: cytochrome c [Comamonadaceae bacterium]|nr:MAG: cytochrome c [Comamonadaceae bacterium]
MKRMLTAIGVLCAALVAGAALVWALNVRGEDPIVEGASGPPTAALVERGAYLARAGNCMGCHTAQGGAAWAGGRGIDTPFGVVFSSNLTPDAATGLGSWSSSQFWRALHNGRSKDGRLLYPAFPYPSYTQVTREDADALFAFLRSLPPQPRPHTAHALRWPYSSQAALAVWRALYFTPAVHQDDPARDAQWNRGAYLVRGLGHCAACHTARNALGATDDALDLAGGLIPMQNWYAPSLASAAEAGVAGWPTGDVVELLKTGVSPRGTVLGPMADVVRHSTQHLNDADLSAMAAFLQSIPQAPAAAAPVPKADARVAAQGARLYEDHCLQCHGARGEGVAGAYPPLAGNRAVTMNATVNLVQVVLAGGFPPATAGNPRPFGMPPYVLTLSDAEVAAVLTHIRTSWGNQAAPVSELEVNRQRGSIRP